MTGSGMAGAGIFRICEAEYGFGKSTKIDTQISV